MNTSNGLPENNDEQKETLRVLIYPDKSLTKTAEHVGTVDDETRDFIDKMFNTMEDRGGIGLAATQVGDMRRIAVIDCHELDVDKDNFSDGIKTSGRYVLINPKITHRLGRVNWRESCLSVPFTEEDVERDMVIHVEAQDENGKPFALQAGGLLSACIQHELDHLDGKLFIDRLSRLKRDMATKKIKKKIKQIKRMWRSA